VYTLLAILGVAVVIYGLVGTLLLFRKQRQKAEELDKGASLSRVKHPVVANPILILYIVIPVFTVVVAMIWIFLTQS